MHPLLSSLKQTCSATAQDFDDQTLRLILTKENSLNGFCFVGVTCSKCKKNSNILVAGIWTFGWKCVCGESSDAPQPNERWQYCHENPDVGPKKELINLIFSDQGLHGLKV